jgi:pimeloyl-ACP methyl ester carboxylesterase
VTTEGTSLHYNRSGTGSPLVLVHGFLGGIAEWDPLTKHLSSRHDVIAVDLPGFGGSAAVPPPGTIAGYGDLIMRFLDSLGIRQFALLGHSMGAMIAQQMALDYAHRLSRLILYGAASTGILPGRFETFETTIERFKRVGIGQGGVPLIASWVRAGRGHPAFAMYRRMADLADSEAAIAALRAVAAWHVTDRLGSITIPTLVIGGDRDRSTEPAEQFRLWRGLAQAQLCILPDCAHAAHLEQPKVFQHLLVRFLSSK